MAPTASDVPGESDPSTVLGEADPSAVTSLLFASEVAFFRLLA